MSTPLVTPTTGTKTEEEVYDSICGICFCEIHPVDNPRGVINSCEHLFCSYCIKEWAKTTNVCPTCKARFTRIFTKDSTSGVEEVTKVRRKNYVAWEENYYDDDDEEEEESERFSSGSPSELVACDVCHEGHNAARMILCDHRECAFAAHLECLDLSERPLTFLCPSCAKRRGSAQIPLSSPSPVPQSVLSPSSSSSSSFPQGPSAPSPPSAAAVKRPFHPPSVEALLLHRPEAVPRPAPQPSRRAAPQQQQAAAGGEDDLYFLQPNMHTREAQTRFRMQNEERTHALQLRREREDAKKRRLQDLLQYQQSRLAAVGQGVGKKRPQNAQAMLQELKTTELQIEEANITNPELRQATEARMTEDWARDMLPVLRRNQQIQENVLRLDDSGNVIRQRPLTTSEVTAKEQALWELALKQSRPIVEAKLAERAAAIRARRELLLKVQSQREAAALAKLARIIAQNRQRNA